MKVKLYKCPILRFVVDFFLYVGEKCMKNSYLGAQGPQGTYVSVIKDRLLYLYICLP